MHLNTALLFDYRTMEYTKSSPQTRNFAVTDKFLIADTLICDQ